MRNLKQSMRHARTSRITNAMRRPATWTVAAFGAGLILAGCGLNDLADLSFDTDDATDSATSRATATTRPQPTNTPWSYQATNTPWAYSTPTEAPWSYEIPTQTPRTPTPTPTATRTPSPTPIPATDYLALLPGEDQVPGKLELAREDKDVTVEEVGEGFGAGAGLATSLERLDYRGGGLREFALPDPGLGDYLSRLLGMQTAVLEFGTDAQATEAMNVQQEFARNQDDWDIKSRDIEQIGDASLALTGDAVYEGTDVKVVAIFVRDGNRVFRFVSISGTYDAWDDTVKLAHTTVP